MAVPTPDVVIPKALVREALPATPPAGSAESLAKRVAAQADKGNWKEGLDIARRNPVDQAKISRRIEQIGVKRNSDTGKKDRTPDEEARFVAASGEAVLPRRFLEVGYKGLTATEKSTLRDKVLAEAGRRPAIAAELASMTAADKTKFAERLINNPKFSGEVRNMFDKALDPQRDLKDSVTPAREKLDEEELKKGEIDLDIADINRRLGLVTTQQAEFRPAGGPLGTKAVELDRLRENLSKNKAELDIQKQQAANAQKELDTLIEEKNSMMSMRSTEAMTRRTELDTTFIPSAQARLKTALEKTVKAQTEIDKVTQLENEEKQINDQKKELEKAQRTKNLELKKAEYEVGRRKNEYEDAKDLRVSQEEDLASDFRNLVGNAANEVINGQVETMVGAMDKELEVLQKETVDQNENALYATLQRRWIQGQDRRINRQMVDQDFAVLLTDRVDGPKAVMRRLLRTSRNPATNVTYTQAEVDALVANNDYMEKMQPEMIRQLLTKRVLTGGITQEDVQVIVTSRWGQGMITEAIRTRDEFRSEVESVMGAEALQRHGFWDRFAQQARTHPKWWLGLMGLGALPAMAAGRMSVEDEQLLRT